MRLIKDKSTILIDITNKCNNSCANCMRFCGHYNNPYYMCYDFFVKAINSLDGWNKQIGIIGGEPLLHPQFKEMSLFLQNKFGKIKNPIFKYPIKNINKFSLNNMTYNEEKLRLYTCCPENFYDNIELICDTYNTLRCNDHTNETKHFSVLANYHDLGISDSEFENRENKCWVQNYCGASITPKGAFFCEMAGALDMLFHGDGGWKVEPGWWNRTDYSEQQKWCKICGARLGLPMLIDKQQFDYITSSIKDKLPYSKKIKNGKYKIITKDDYDNYNVQWDNDKEKQLHIVSEVGISNNNKNVFPRNIDVVDNIQSIDFNKINDWIIVKNDIADYKKLREKIDNCVLNIGCFYYYNSSFMFCVKSLAINNKNIDNNIWGCYELNKIVNLKISNVNDINNNSNNWEDVKKKNIVNNILRHLN